MNGVNLIPASRRESSSRRKRLRAWVGAGAAYALICVSAYAVCQMVWGGTGRALADQAASASGEVDHSREELRVLRANLAEVEARLQATRSVSDQPDWSVLMALVSKLLGDDVVLDACRLGEPSNELSAAEESTVGPDGYLLTLRGFGQSQMSVSRFVLRLEETQLFDRVTLVKTSRANYLQTEAVAFHVECTLARGSAVTQ